MAEANAEKSSVQLTERQLAEMAREEEYELANKRRLMERVGGVLMETTTTKEVLKELQKTKGKVQISIGATIIIDASVENNKTCKRAFSDNAYKEEPIEETIAWLEKKEGEIKKEFEALQKEAEVNNKRLTDIVGILKQIDVEKRKAASRAPPSISK